MKKQFVYKRTEGGYGHSPLLLINLGIQHGGFVIVSADLSTLYHAVWFLSKKEEPILLSNLLTEIPAFSANDFNVEVLLEIPGYQLYPSRVMHVAMAEEWLRDLGYYDKGNVLLKDDLHDWQMANCYSVPSYLLNDIFSVLHQPYKKHYISAVMRGARPDWGEELMLADFRTSWFHVVVVRNSGLLLANTFAFQAAEDVLYYLLKICKYLKLSQSSVRLYLSGFVNRESEIYKELYKYFYVEFREADWGSTSDIPAHYFTHLNDLARCELSAEN
ncbi:MAG: DUF3822 family protein [Chitinophagaceae bacterium]|nr:DUF3822 family protein [Chitinophagaceae bacterium]